MIMKTATPSKFAIRAGGIFGAYKFERAQLLVEKALNSEKKIAKVQNGEKKLSEWQLESRIIKTGKNDDFLPNLKARPRGRVLASLGLGFPTTSEIL